MQIKKYLLIIKEILSLSFSLAKANFKLRNEGSFLGILWYLLDPLSFFVILLLLSNVIFQNTIEKYPLYLFLGLIMFNFFVNATTNSVKAIVQNAGFIKSIKINKHAFVIAVVLQYVFSHIFELIIFAIFMLYFKANVLGILLYFVVFLPFVLFVLGLGFVLSVLGVYVLDFFNVWEIFARLLWFVTPIFYVLKPSTYIYFINKFNPVYYFLNASRQIVIYGKISNWQDIFLVWVLGSVVLILGILIFNKFSKKIAEKL